MPPSDRHHVRIGEAAALVGVPTHVIRYWEDEFPALRPKKTRGAQRHFGRDDLALLHAIKALVVDEGYSIAGARKKLSEGGDHRDASRAELEAARDELHGLLRYLDDSANRGPRQRADDVPVAASESEERALQTRRGGLFSRPLR